MTAKQHEPVRPDDGPDEHEPLRALLHSIAERIDHAIKEAGTDRPIAFGLFLCETGDDGARLWISNAEGASIAAALQECLEQEDKQ